MCPYVVLLSVRTGGCHYNFSSGQGYNCVYLQRYLGILPIVVIKIIVHQYADLYRQLAAKAQT